MSNNEEKMSEYLSELVENSPSSFMKLDSIWDDLSAETQLYLFNKIKNGRYYCFLSEKFYLKVLESKNPYLRYLAAKSLNIYEKDNESWKAIKKKIESDPNPLVKYCLHEMGKSFKFMDDTAKEPMKFFGLPQEARLAYIRSGTLFGTVEVLIKYALENLIPKGELTEDELRDILLDYVNNPDFKRWYAADEPCDDGDAEYSRGKELAALWDLIPNMSEKCAAVFLNNLPTGAGFQQEIPEKLLDKLQDWQIYILLERKDFGSVKIRKKMFFDKNRSDLVRGAAVDYNFDLKYEDFAEILKLDKEEKTNLFKKLEYAVSLNICIRMAIYDIQKIESEEYVSSRDVRKFFERRKKELSQYQWDNQMLMLRLYELAKSIVPLDKNQKPTSLPEGLEGLGDGVVENDTWQTFIRFSNLWYSVSRLENPSHPKEDLLPKVDSYLIGHEETEETDKVKSTINESKTILHLLNIKMNDLIRFADSRIIIRAVATGLFIGGMCFVVDPNIRVSVGIAVASGFVSYILSVKDWDREMKQRKEIQDRLKDCKPEHLGSPD